MKWTKPNSTEIETRETPEIVAYCKSLGWSEVKPEPKQEPKPRGRPRKQAE